MRVSHLILAVFISFLWGLNFVAAKAAVLHFPTFFLLGLRLSIVALVLLPFIKRPDFSFVSIVSVSVTWALFHFGFMFLGLDYGVDVSVASVVDQLRVPFASLLGFYVLKERFGVRSALGTVVAIIGTVVIFGTPNVEEHGFAFGCILVSTVAWAVYNVQIKQLGKLDMLSFIGWISLCAAPFYLIFSGVYEEGQWQSMLSATPAEIASLLYLSLGATIVAHGSWYYLVKQYSVNEVVPFSLLIPLFAVVCAVLLLNEQITWQIVVGGVLTVVGVGVVVMKRPIVFLKS